jgi:hypothetical protein
MAHFATRRTSPSPGSLSLNQRDSSQTQHPRVRQAYFFSKNGEKLEQSSKLPANKSKPISSFSDDEDDFDRDHTISLTEDNFTFSDTEEEAFMMH